LFTDAISYCSALVTSPAPYLGGLFFKHGARKRHLQMMKFFPLFCGISGSGGGIFYYRKTGRIFFSKISLCLDHVRNSTHNTL